MKKRRAAGQHALRGESGSRAHTSHTVFDDPGCSVASHHRCASLAPACSCDSVGEGETSRHECACGHAHWRLSAADRESAQLSEAGIL